MLACHPPRVERADPRTAAQSRLIRIEDTRADEPAWLDSMLAMPDASLRRSAAITAGRIGARGHRPALRRLAVDPDTSVAAAALFALGLLKDTSSVELATAGLRSAPSVSREAAWLLGEVGTAGRAALLTAIGDTSLGSRRRSGALLALARIRPVEVEPIARLLNDADTAIAWRAAYVLARGRTPSAVRMLLGAANSPSADVRDYAARGLVRALAGDSLGGEALATLRRLSKDSSARVRVSAVRGAGGYGVLGASVIAEALRDADPSVRITAAPFAHFSFDTSSRAWDEAWRADTSFVMRRQLAEAASRKGRLIAAWAPWRADSRWERRAAAAELDGLAPPRLALTRLDQALGDADGRVRAAATGALAQLADSTATMADARTRLRTLLADSDFEVRATALGALTKGATIDDLSSAIASYTANRADRDLDARLAFWTLADSALARNTGPLPESLTRALAAIDVRRIRSSASARRASPGFAPGGIAAASLGWTAGT